MLKKLPEIHILWPEEIMLKYVFGLLCVWYSVSVFSKTEILFEHWTFIPEIEFWERNMPLFMLYDQDDGSV